VLLYERHGLHTRTTGLLGMYPQAPTEDGVLSGISASDFVLLCDPGPRGSPFDRVLASLAPRVRAVCERDMVRLGTFWVRDNGITLYARRALKVEGGTGGWVTRRGLGLSGPAGVLRGCREIRLDGPFPRKFLGKVPGVRAELRLPGLPTRSLPAGLAVQGDSYRLVVDLQRAPVPAEGPVEIHLTFDAGGAPGARPLILPVPRRQEMVRRQAVGRAPGPQGPGRE
jgi:hypothetical protein